MNRRPRLLDLPHGFRAVIDEGDYPLVEGLTLYRGVNGYVYYSTWEGDRSVPRTLHSLIIGTIQGKHVDHINGDKLDNRRDNLRHASYTENQVNRKRLNKNNSSGVRGVHWSRATGRWIAQITFRRKNHYLGSFELKADAIDARKRAERALFREECP